MTDFVKREDEIMDRLSAQYKVRNEAVSWIDFWLEMYPGDAPVLTPVREILTKKSDVVA